MTDINSRLLDWFNSGKTGASSKCIAFHLTGRDSSGDYPHDASDFGRCVGLLNAVPELRVDLPKMASLNRYWAALVEQWDEIEALSDYRAQTQAIRKVLRPIEDADPNLFRLDACTIRFGGIKP